MNSKKVSVIMPAYNAEKYIEEAVRSVIAQTYQNWELFIIDDCSSDRTPEIAKRFSEEDSRIVFLQNEENVNVAKTRNRGFDCCTGDYVALLDSDDIWLPEKLEKQIKKMEETGADISYCSYGIMSETGEKAKPDYIVSEKVDFDKLLKENIIGCSTVLLSSEIAKKYRFMQNFYHEDYVLWLKILEDGYKAAGCTEVLVQWRFFESSRSFDKRNGAKSRWIIYRKYLKLPLWKSFWCFGNYAAAGIKKYFIK